MKNIMTATAPATANYVIVITNRRAVVVGIYNDYKVEITLSQALKAIKSLRADGCKVHNHFGKCHWIAF